jgi:hypothetical protein
MFNRKSHIVARGSNVQQQLQQAAVVSRQWDAWNDRNTSTGVLAATKSVTDQVRTQYRGGPKSSESIGTEETDDWFASERLKLECGKKQRAMLKVEMDQIMERIEEEQNQIQKYENYKGDDPLLTAERRMELIKWHTKFLEEYKDIYKTKWEMAYGQDSGKST